MCPPPFYAHWGIHASEEEMNEDIAASVRHVGDVVARHGPFHAVVGFSQVVCGYVCICIRQLTWTMSEMRTTMHIPAPLITPHLSLTLSSK